MNEKERIQEAYETMLTEAKTAKISDVADLFLRALIGDRSYAGREIAKLSNSDIEGIEPLLDKYVGRGKDMKDPGAYNKLWDDLYKALHDAIAKTIKGR